MAAKERTDTESLPAGQPGPPPREIAGRRRIEVDGNIAGEEPRPRRDSPADGHAGWQGSHQKNYEDAGAVVDKFLPLAPARPRLDVAARDTADRAGARKGTILRLCRTECLAGSLQRWAVVGPRSDRLEGGGGAQNGLIDVPATDDLEPDR